MHATAVCVCARVCELDREARNQRPSVMTMKCENTQFPLGALIAPDYRKEGGREGGEREIGFNARKSL